MPNRLRPVRAERRITQLKLARLCHMSPSRVWRIENDEYAPTPEERERLSRVLEIDEKVIWPTN